MKFYLSRIALLFMLLLLSRNISYSQDDNHAQKCWTLEECIRFARDNNIELKSEKLSIREANLSLSDSKWAFAPNLSASTVYNLSIGRVLDETTYEFVTNQTMRSSNSSVSIDILLFDGLRNLRQLQYSKLNKEAAVLKYRKAENDLCLNITAYYLEVLCALENFKNCSNIVESLKKQEQLVSIKVHHGKINTIDLLQIQSKLADAENTLLSAKHSYDLSRMNLCQLIEVKDYYSFVPSMTSIDSVPFNHYTHMDILSTIEKLPEIAMTKKNIELSKKNVEISKSQYYPSLSLSFGYGSSYSNARQKVLQNGNGSYTYTSYPFWEQYKDNVSQYVSLGLKIPLFSNSTINSIKKARLEVKRNEYAYYTAKKQAEKELTKVIMDTETAWKKYQGSKKYLSSVQETMRQITLKLEAGKIGAFEYSEVISSLKEAQTQHLSSKYEYIFKVKVLDLYQNDFLLKY